MFFFNNSSCCCNRKPQCVRCEEKHECDRHNNCNRCCNCCCRKEVQRPVRPHCCCRCHCMHMGGMMDNNMD